MSSATEIPAVELVKSVATESLRAGPLAASPIGVDEENGTINGVVVAELGPFRTGRGAFDMESLAATVRLMSANDTGAIANYGHQKDPGSSEALNAFLGRHTNPRIDTSGEKPRVRTDLKFNPVAFMSVNGGESPAKRLMTRAKTDPDSFGSSLVLEADREYRLDARGRRLMGENGEPLPPVWRPTKISGCDVVYLADAVKGGFLSTDDSFGRASAALDEILAEFDRETLCKYFELYLATRFANSDQAEGTPDGDLSKETPDGEPAGVMCSADEIDLLRRRNEHRKRKAGLE